jgi:hypothetical protein
MLDYFKSLSTNRSLQNIKALRKLRKLNNLNALFYSLSKIKFIHSFHRNAQELADHKADI